MESILRQFVNAAPIKVNLEFGINDNIVLRAVDISQRMAQGSPSSRNTFLTFTEVHPVTRKPIKEKEYAFFNLNHSSEYVIPNLEEKMTKLNAITSALGISEVVVDEAIELYLTKGGFDESQELEDIIKTAKGALGVDKALSEGFYSVVKDKIGLDSTLLRLKTTVDKKGYLHLPKYGDFVEPMIDGKTKLKMTMKDFKMKDEAMETKKVSADKLGTGASNGGKLDLGKLGL